jgi:hypothetical protein
MLSSCDYYIVNIHNIEEAAESLAEKCYFEGQKDYAEGDIRVKLTNDSCWVWIKSPWNDDKPPKFRPTCYGE